MKDIIIILKIYLPRTGPEAHADFLKDLEEKLNVETGRAYGVLQPSGGGLCSGLSADRLGSTAAMP